MHLSDIKGFLLDMDGTFYMGDHLLPGALELLNLFNKRRLPFIFLTNNSSRSRKEYVKRLIRLGIRESDAHVFTSGDAPARYIREKTAYERIFLVGTQYLHETFLEAGLHLVQDQPDLVVLGYDTSLTYDKVNRLCSFLAGGLPFIATHPDINCPTSTGFAPDIGAMLALVKASTGREPDLIVGKPNRIIIDMVAGELGLQAGDLTMIGDRLYTDIALGQTARLTTVLVLTGETKLADLPASPFQPDYVFDDLNGVIKAISGR
jgi:HAD superfamily hydrolase (TIGR01457 family)